jgi:alpha-1,2-rhamnosyltransferase
MSHAIKTNPIKPLFKAGDVLLLTSFYHMTPEKTEYFEKLLSTGLCVVAIIYDMIPITHAQYCNDATITLFNAWAKPLQRITEGIICISQFTADTVQNVLKYDKPSAVVHLGYTETDKWKKIHLPRGKNVLMVSTLEPRKKYDETLKQFERIWQTRDDINLIIVGKVGWNVKELETIIKNHPRRMTNLFFLIDLSDAELNYLYKNCDLFLFSSDVEGFGLGIVEAARFGTPLLLHDIPVFREIAGEHATYFDAFEELPKIIFDNIDNGFKRCDNMPIMSWSDTAIAYLHIINQIRNLYAHKLNSEKRSSPHVK